MKLPARVKVATVATTGAVTGLALPTLAAEFTSRATGQTGWNACGVKALVKTVIGVPIYLLSGRLEGAAAMFAEMFAYTSWGSIILDVVLAAYPGGIPGLAEDAASMVRVASAGGRRVVRELGTIEKTAGAPLKASTVF